jgi:hypothetical protein
MSASRTKPRRLRSTSCQAGVGEHHDPRPPAHYIALCWAKHPCGQRLSRPGISFHPGNMHLASPSAKSPALLLNARTRYQVHAGLPSSPACKGRWCRSPWSPRGTRSRNTRPRAPCSQRARTPRPPPAGSPPRGSAGSRRAGWPLGSVVIIKNIIIGEPSSCARSTEGDEMPHDSHRELLREMRDRDTRTECDISSRDAIDGVNDKADNSPLTFISMPGKSRSQRPP